jgi:single-stranded DNA-binding protein
MSIDCAFFAFCAADAEPKVSKAGKNWTRLRVGVGEGDAITWLTVAAFGRGAEIAAELKKSNRCYVEGTIRLDTWRGADGVERHGLSVAAFRIDRTHRIGRNRPNRENDDTGGRPSTSRSDVAGGSVGSAAHSDFHNDPLPFAPEVR